MANEPTHKIVRRIEDVDAGVGKTATETLTAIVTTANTGERRLVTDASEW